ncbi:hypothetical protein PV08_00670 [Exophiala spinifera]|uniref:Rhodopsin domain-containing protein n=1 Tax=Exophiala spinifera TaxID=91928 RepID=A0A0D2BNJ0_9EURO|nr:uncharacterized protein PV08_00670 [Exophiala spinifera]KIW20095.1 hypothetical protein PV08_00670 [Exophiala spinifera]
MADLQLTPGQSPPLAIITDTDQRGVLWIITGIGLATVATSLVIRAYVRIEFSRSYGLDDISIAVASLFFVIQSALVIVAVRDGIGRTLPENTDLVSLQKTYYASNLFYILSLWTSKISNLLLIYRLSVQRAHKLTTQALIAVTLLLGVIGFLLIALVCDLSHPWIFIGEKCSGVGARWEAIAAFDIFTELAAFAVIFYIVWSIQIARDKKMAIVTGFDDSTFSSPSRDKVVITTQTELVVALVAATVPCLKPFMGAVDTSFGAAAGTSLAGSGYNKRSTRSGNGGQYSNESKTALSSNGFRIRRKKNGVDALTSHDDIALEPMSRSWTGKADLEDQTGDRNTSTTTKPSTDDHQSVGSQDSQQMIIRRDVEWNVRYESRQNDADNVMERIERYNTQTHR